MEHLLNSSSDYSDSSPYKLMYVFKVCCTEVSVSAAQHSLLVLNTKVYQSWFLITCLPAHGGRGQWLQCPSGTASLISEQPDRLQLSNCYHLILLEIYLDSFFLR